MQVSELFTDDSAVSPVIGVILMVAVTVILAAVIAAFVLGFGQQNESPPTVTFDYEVNQISGSNDEVIVQHISGDDFRSDRVEFEGSGLATTGETWTVQAGLSDETTVRAGQEATIGITDEDFELDLVWSKNDGEQSSIISSTSGPVPENPAP
jgi:flagellin-like protein